MAERTLTKPEIASQKRVIKLPPAIGDWTAYRPREVLVKKIKSGLYGFDRLSKEELNQALLIHYRFIQILLRHLKIDLGLGVEFLACQIEQTNYLNFLRTLSGPVVQSKLTVAPLHEAIQLYFDLNLANSLINHALGSHDFEPLNRALTGAEAATFSTAITEYLPDFTAVFNKIFPDPSFTFLGAPDVTLDSSINPSSTFVLFSAEVTLNDSPGKIIFGYPGNSLKSLLKSWDEKEKKRPANFARLPFATLNKILIPIMATLGRTALLTSELNRLEEGDVVSLDTLTNAPVNLQIGKALEFKVQPGILDNRRAIRLAGFRDEAEIEITPPTMIEESPPAAPPVVEAAPVAAAEVETPAPAEEPLSATDNELAEEEFAESLTEEDLDNEEFPEDFLAEEETPEEEKGG
jgi:flagellar motor switch protein FliM